MRRVDSLLGEYGACHAHPVNRALHWIFVPVILFSVLGLLWSLPVPRGVASLSPWTNWSTLVAAASLVYYAVLSWSLAAGMLLLLAGLFPLVHWAGTLDWPLWGLCLVMLVVALAAQIIGHRIEGRRPAFVRDLEFLLIGPAWLLAKLYRRLGIPF